MILIILFPILKSKENTIVNIFALSLSAIILYFAATVLRIYQLGNISPKHLLLLLGGLAVSLHALVLYLNLITPSGLNLGFFNAASLMSWMIVVLLLISLPRQPVENLTIVLFPIAALSLGLENFFHSEHILSLDTKFGVTLHILSGIIAYSLLSISALQALFLAFQDYKLRHKHPGWVMQKLPPLQVMETLLFQIITFGDINLLTKLIVIWTTQGLQLLYSTM